MTEIPFEDFRDDVQRVVSSDDGAKCLATRCSLFFPLVFYMMACLKLRFDVGRQEFRYRLRAVLFKSLLVTFIIGYSAHQFDRFSDPFALGRIGRHLVVLYVTMIFTIVAVLPPAGLDPEPQIFHIFINDNLHRRRMRNRFLGLNAFVSMPPPIDGGDYARSFLDIFDRLD